MGFTDGLRTWCKPAPKTLDTEAGRAVGQGPGDDELLDWFVSGHAALVSALRDAPPDLVVETFLPAPTPLHFWARRQAHETAVHCADADAACGQLANFAPEFAQDGMGELLLGFAARKSKALDAGATILLDALDGPSWLVTLGGERIRADVVENGNQVADDADTGDRLSVRGASSDLYLWLWNRDSNVVIDGSEQVADLWATTVRIRWS